MTSSKATPEAPAGLRPSGYDPERELALEANYADHMASMAAYWMERAEKAEKRSLQTICGLVTAAGGRIDVKAFDLQDMDNFVLEHWQNLDKMTETFAVRDKRDSGRLPKVRE